MLPWIGACLILAIPAIYLDFAPYSYPQIALAVIIMAPWFIGIGLIWRVWWRVFNKRIDSEPVIETSNG